MNKIADDDYYELLQEAFDLSLTYKLSSLNSMWFDHVMILVDLSEDYRYDTTN